MSPFYPLKAKEKGITIIWIGFVIGIMALFQIVSGIIVGKFLHKMGGRQYVIMLGSFFIICQTALLGNLEYVKGFNEFLFISFLAQILGGIGAGANCTASMAILSSFESEEREMYIGYIEAANGIGLLFGPLFGAALYSYGGYTMPFLTFSTLYLTAYPFIYWSLNKSKS